jgi:hypothetical protein
MESENRAKTLKQDKYIGSGSVVTAQFPNKFSTNGEIMLKEIIIEAIKEALKTTLADRLTDLLRDPETANAILELFGRLFS